MDEKQRDTVSLIEEEQPDESITFPATVIIRSMLQEILAYPGYTIVKVAAEVGTSTATIRRLLQGSTQNPSVRTFDRIIRLYCLAISQNNEQPNNNSSE